MDLTGATGSRSDGGGGLTYFADESSLENGARGGAVPRIFTGQRSRGRLGSGKVRLRVAWHGELGGGTGAPPRFRNPWRGTASVRGGSGDLKCTWGDRFPAEINGEKVQEVAHGHGQARGANGGGGDLLTRPESTSNGGGCRGLR